MNRVFSFKNGDYELALDMDALDTFPRKNLCKVLRQLRDRPEEVQRLSELFQESLAEVMDARDAASKALADNWRPVNKRSRTLEARKILRQNRELESALRRAEIRYTAYQKLYELFQERKGN